MVNFLRTKLKTAGILKWVWHWIERHCNRTIARLWETKVAVVEPLGELKNEIAVVEEREGAKGSPDGHGFR